MSLVIGNKWAKSYPNQKLALVALEESARRINQTAYTLTKLARMEGLTIPLKNYESQVEIALASYLSDSKRTAASTSTSLRIVAKAIPRIIEPQDQLETLRDLLEFPELPIDIEGSRLEKLTVSHIPLTYFKNLRSSLKLPRIYTQKTGNKISYAHFKREQSEPYVNLAYTISLTPVEM
jgi:hypothetical protein